jgi:hypothetical protein
LRHLSKARDHSRQRRGWARPEKHESKAELLIPENGQKTISAFGHSEVVFPLIAHGLLTERFLWQIRCRTEFGGEAQAFFAELLSGACDFFPPAKKLFFV